MWPKTFRLFVFCQPQLGHGFRIFTTTACWLLINIRHCWLVSRKRLGLIWGQGGEGRGALLTQAICQHFPAVIFMFSTWSFRGVRLINSDLTWEPLQHVANTAGFLDRTGQVFTPVFSLCLSYFLIAILSFSICQ